MCGPGVAAGSAEDDAAATAEVPPLWSVPLRCPALCPWMEQPEAAGRWPSSEKAADGGSTGPVDAASSAPRACDGCAFPPCAFGCCCCDGCWFCCWPAPPCALRPFCCCCCCCAPAPAAEPGAAVFVDCGAPAPGGGPPLAATWAALRCCLSALASFFDRPAPSSLPSWAEAAPFAPAVGGATAALLPLADVAASAGF